MKHLNLKCLYETELVKMKEGCNMRRDNINLKKVKTYIMAGLLCVLLTGCSNEFAKREYNDADRIAKTEDRYAKEKSVFNPIDNGYSLVADKFDGRETLWTKTLEENEDIEINIKLSLSEGTAKVVHVDEDGNVATIIECKVESEADEETKKTVSLKKGLNWLKIVGYGCKDIDLELLSSAF